VSGAADPSAGRFGVVLGSGALWSAAVVEHLLTSGDRVALLQVGGALGDAQLSVLDGRSAAPARPAQSLRLTAGEVEQALRAAVGAGGRISYLVAVSESPDEDFGDADPGGWPELLAANVLAPLYALRAVLPLMDGRSGARVILVGGATSPASAVDPVMTHATSWAVAGLAHAARSELAESGIAVSGVEVPMGAGTASPASGGRDRPELVDEVARRVCRLLGEPAVATTAQLVIVPHDGAARPNA
jgi:NAD(P)-dependent dehydrogenase (short-subunit alcohol dehydrogenase family)